MNRDEEKKLLLPFLCFKELIPPTQSEPRKFILVTTQSFYSFKTRSSLSGHKSLIGSLLTGHKTQDPNCINVKFLFPVLTRSSRMSGCGGASIIVMVYRMSCMWLLRWRTGLAMTVFVGAMHADSRGRVVGRGRGDCSCFTVVSYRVKTEDGFKLWQTLPSATIKDV